MKQVQFYGFLAALIILILAAVILPGLYSRITSSAPQSGVLTPAAVLPQPVIPEPANLSIENIKEQAGDMSYKDSGSPQSGPSTLAQVYEKYPDATVGNNMVASWARTSPEEKAKVEEHLDREIAAAQDTLKANPEDKDAKHMVFIASTLKKLCKNNFDYNFLETVPEEEGGLLPRSKKTSRP